MVGNKCTLICSVFMRCSAFSLANILATDSIHTDIHLGRRSSMLALVFNTSAYCAVSSMLLVVNKITVGHIPLPGFVLVAQLLTAIVFVKVMELSADVAVDRLDARKVGRCIVCLQLLACVHCHLSIISVPHTTFWPQALSFSPAICGFVGMLFSNVKALQNVPVDTFICARASTPIMIALAESAFLGRRLPSVRSWMALLGLLTGVWCYVSFDYHFSVAGYMWLGIWYSIAVAEMIVVKQIVTNVDMTTWGRTYYMNALSLPPLLLLGLLSGELGRLNEVQWSATSVGFLVTSCLGGVGICYFSFALRAMVSATSFSLIGNICKVLTIFVNILIWEQHANIEGTAALLFCLCTSALYQQAPMRRMQK
mmetsp:Transcript_16120/g.40964  ORF Transcript_16120/g.40964 Transcript_16120/m.40964 type:complete len:368 (+) Transcript_16120:408-1511(+)